MKSADIRFSKSIRDRDGWMCRRCGRGFLPGSVELHNAHHFTRRTQATRFDPLNCLSLCASCHLFLDTHPALKEQFWRRVIGDEAFDALTLRAHVTFPRPQEEAG